MYNVLVMVPTPDITVVAVASILSSLLSDVSDGNTCPEVITRTYSITDDCGNAITVTQTITIDDDINPTASNPAPSMTCPEVITRPLPMIVVPSDGNPTNPAVLKIYVSDGNTLSHYR